VKVLAQIIAVESESWRITKNNKMVI